MTLDLVLVDWKYGKTIIFAAPRNSTDGDLTAGRRSRFPKI